MTTLELYNKYQHSGINGSPIISDKELALLLEKLQETKEFISKVNPFVLGMVCEISSVERSLSARNEKY